MAIEGSLELFALPEILQMISAQRKTGILTVQGEHDIFALSFKDGQVVAADALNQTVEEGLGQVLASQGLVSPADFAEVHGEHEAGGKRLFDLLLERGLVDRGRLLEALRTQTYQLLLQLLRWEQGDFKFYAGDEVAYEEGFYAISVEELLIRSLTDLGAEGHDELPDLSLAYERVVGGARIRYLGEDGDAPSSDPSAVWLGSDERRLVERLDGQASAEQIAGESGLGEYKVLFALHRLVKAGAARPAAAMASLAQPEPAAPAAAAQVRAPSPMAREGAARAPAAPLGPRRLEVTPPPIQAPAAPAASPPRPQPRPAVRVAPQPPQVTLTESWARALAALGVLGLLALGTQAPSALLLPFPWQEGVRQGFEHNQRVALYQQVDRAARAFFLLEGHYPDALSELVHLGLLAPESLVDGGGRPLAYSTDELSYELLPVEAGVSMAELGTREAITGDFLLDPDFLRLPDQPQQAPLVLLD